MIKKFGRNYWWGYSQPSPIAPRTLSYQLQVILLGCNETRKTNLQNEKTSQGKIVLFYCVVKRGLSACTILTKNSEYNKRFILWSMAGIQYWPRELQHLQYTCKLHAVWRIYTQNASANGMQKNWITWFKITHLRDLRLTWLVDLREKIAT